MKQSFIFFRIFAKEMNTTTEILTQIARIKPILQKEYALSSIGVFGSISDGSFNENSDVDILVEFAKPIGWRVFSMEMFLEKQLHRRIDLVTKEALKPQLKNQILNSVVYL